MGWKLRVALTNGPERHGLLTVWTSTKGVHASVPGDKLHSSYHVDGRRHVTGAPDKDTYKRRFYPPVLVRMKTPMADLVGVEELHVVTLRNEPLHFGKDSGFPSMSEKQGLVWPIDHHELQANAAHQVSVGIVGSGGRAALDQHIAELTRDGTWIAAQSKLGEDLSPTPYLVVLRARDENAHTIGQGWASNADATTLCDGQPFTLRMPPEFRPKVPPPPYKPAVWPPVPCDNSARVVYEFSPFAQPYVRVPNTDLLLAVPQHKPGNSSDFILLVNPREVCITAGNQVLHRVPGHPTGPAIAYRLLFGPEGRADAKYEIAGRTYYIRCYGAGGMSKGSYEVVQYRFEIQWS
jgi:hypothetical protein